MADPLERKACAVLLGELTRPKLSIKLIVSSTMGSTRRTRIPVKSFLGEQLIARVETGKAARGAALGCLHAARYWRSAEAFSCGAGGCGKFVAALPGAFSLGR
jgi:hypothetical protein